MTKGFIPVREELAEYKMVGKYHANESTKKKQPGGPLLPITHAQEHIVFISGICCQSLQH